MVLGFVLIRIKQNLLQIFISLKNFSLINLPGVQPTEQFLSEECYPFHLTFFYSSLCFSTNSTVFIEGQSIHLTRLFDMFSEHGKVKNDFSDSDRDLWEQTKRKDSGGEVPNRKKKEYKQLLESTIHQRQTAAASVFLLPPKLL